MKPSEILKQLLVKVPFKHVGICTNFDSLNPTEDVLLSVYMEQHDIEFSQWPLYSGYVNCPVPHPYSEANLAYTLSENKWDRRTQYGRNRYALLMWLIEQFEAKGA